MNPNQVAAQIAQDADRLLAELTRRQAVVRDYVRAVARGYATWLYLFGRPGTAKTHTVRAALEGEIREPYVYQRGHVTPLGLFELLAQHPDEVIVLDDVGSVLRSEVAVQVLLSAIEHPTGRDRGRVVKYRRQGREQRAVFQGGVVVMSNLELHDDELLGAFKSRVHTLNYDPTDAQLGALALSKSYAARSMRLWVTTRSTISRFWAAHRRDRRALPRSRSCRLNPLSTCHRWPYTRLYREPFGRFRNRRAICRRYFPRGGFRRPLRPRQ